MLSRKLIAAAGNAGGGVSYWIDEWVPPNTDDYITRVSVNSNRSSILLVAISAYPYFIELDYDGNPIRKSYFSTTTSLNNSYLLDVFPYGSDYAVVHQNPYSGGYVWTLGLVDETSSTNLREAYRVTYNNTASPPYATYQPGGYQPGTQRIYANDSYIAKFDGGYDSFSQSPNYVTAVGAAKMTYSGTTLTVANTNGFITNSGYEEAYDDLRRAQISSPYGSNYHLIRWWHYSYNSNWYSTWNASTGAVSTPMRVAGANQSSGIKLGVNPTNGYLFDITSNNGTACVIYYQTTGNVNTYYYPDTRRNINWNTVTSSTTGYIMDAAIDSDGNMYLLWGRGYIMKISSSFTLEWAASITDSTASYVLASNDEPINSIRIEDVDGTEVMFVTMRLSAKSGQTTKNIQIHKLPLDLDNYYGTYGNVTYAAVNSSYVTIGSATAQATYNAPVYYGETGTNNNLTGNLIGPTDMTSATWTVNQEPIT